MIPGYIIRAATLADVPQLVPLYTITMLTKSGPADAFDDDRRRRNWQNRDVTLPLVACPATHPHLVGAIAEIISVGTSARNAAQLECVATNPAHEGRNLSRALIGRLFWYAQNVWGVSKINWTSEALDERERARAFYREVVGAQIVHGTNCNFSVKLPWEVPENMQPYFVDPCI